MSEFIEAVRRHGEFESDEEARDAARATLRALGKRIALGEATDLAEHLPDDAASWIVPEDGPEEATSLSEPEFVAYVADLADVDEERGYDYAEAGFGGLAEAVPDAEFAGVESQLPPEYDRLLVEV